MFPRWVVARAKLVTGTTTHVHLDSFVDAEVSNLFGEIAVSVVLVAAVAIAVDDGCLAAGDVADIWSRCVGGCLGQREFDVDF